MRVDQSPDHLILQGNDPADLLTRLEELGLPAD
jgi:hypothetical protein